MYSAETLAENTYTQKNGTILQLFLIIGIVHSEINVLSLFTHPWKIVLPQNEKKK